MIGSRYDYRVVRADKVTPKQIRTLRWGRRYDVTARESALFAGAENDAKALCAKLVEAQEEFRKNKAAAEREYHERCEPFKAACNAQIEAFRADYAARRAELLAELEAA